MIPDYSLKQKTYLNAKKLRHFTFIRRKKKYKQVSEVETNVKNKIKLTIYDILLIESITKTNLIETPKKTNDFILNALFSPIFGGSSFIRLNFS